MFDEIWRCPKNWPLLFNTFGRLRRCCRRRWYYWRRHNSYFQSRCSDVGTPVDPWHASSSRRGLSNSSCRRRPPKAVQTCRPTGLQPAYSIAADVRTRTAANSSFLSLNARSTERFHIGFSVFFWKITRIASNKLYAVQIRTVVSSRPHKYTWAVGGNKEGGNPPIPYCS